MEFITKEEWNKIRQEDSVELFNEVLTRFFNKAVETSLRSMPELISRLVKKNVAMEKITKAFFDKNPKFLGNKEIVTQAIIEVELKNPEATYEEILSLATPEINKRIASVTSIQTQHKFEFKEDV